SIHHSQIQRARRVHPAGPGQRCKRRWRRRFSMLLDERPREGHRYSLNFETTMGTREAYCRFAGRRRVVLSVEVPLLSFVTGSTSEHETFTQRKPTGSLQIISRPKEGPHTRTA